VAELEVVMIDHDLHHQVLQDAVNHVESAQSAPGASRPPPHVRRVPGDADAGDPAADPVPMAHKLEFPKFDGIGDPLPWLNRCERFFHMRWTPDDKRVAWRSQHSTCSTTPSFGSTAWSSTEAAPPSRSLCSLSMRTSVHL
jgi:hypothetical protein